MFSARAAKISFKSAGSKKFKAMFRARRVLFLTSDAARTLACAPPRKFESVRNSSRRCVLPARESTSFCAILGSLAAEGIWYDVKSRTVSVDSLSATRCTIQIIHVPKYAGFGPVKTRGNGRSSRSSWAISLTVQICPASSSSIVLNAQDPIPDAASSEAAAEARLLPESATDPRATGAPGPKQGVPDSAWELQTEARPLLQKALEFTPAVVESVDGREALAGTLVLPASKKTSGWSSAESVDQCDGRAGALDLTASARTSTWPSAESVDRREARADNLAFVASGTASTGLSAESVDNREARADNLALTASGITSTWPSAESVDKRDARVDNLALTASETLSA
mmetsp:Transcript_29623/g.80040  ORF Transcript_29623/g.80040 Transcript_29623/m.80040 type:complete len:343 (-) Transcript_29623:1323-2351(-)